MYTVKRRISITVGWLPLIILVHGISITPRTRAHTALFYIYINMTGVGTEHLATNSYDYEQACVDRRIDLT